MSEKEMAIENILNEVGKILPFDRIKMKDVIGNALLDYQVKFESDDIIHMDLKEKIDAYFLCKSISKTLNENSSYQYRLKLNKFANVINKPIDKIRPDDIRLFLSMVQTENNISMETLKTYVVVLRSFFDFLIEEEYLSKNPMNKIKMPKSSQRIRVSLNEEELEKLRNACQTIREKAIVEFIFSTACRVSEVSNVKITDIDFDKKELNVIGKGDKERKVFFSSKCKLLLLEYLLNRGFNSEYLFCASKKPHNKLSTESIEKEVRNIKKRINIEKDVYPHILRHTWATLALKSGVPLDTIQVILGHSKITTTQIYAAEDRSKVEYECRRFLG